MIFHAEVKDKTWEITVNETRKGWQVCLKPEDGELVKYEFSKTDYQHMDDTISFLFKDSSYLLDVTNDGLDYTVYTRGAYRSLKLYNEEKILHESLKAGGSLGGGDALVAQMPGKIVKLFVEVGDEVKQGDPLLIMEAMKMENEMRADRDCKIKAIHVKAGENIEANTNLVSFE